MGILGNGHSMFFRRLWMRCRFRAHSVHQSHSLRFSINAKAGPTAINKHGTSSSRGVRPKRVSSRIYLQVIGTLSRDTAPSVLLFTDSQRYLFNCGENIVQLAHHLDLSLNVSKLFLTGIKWKHIGALTKFHIPSQDADFTQRTQIFGPKGIAKFMKSTEFVSSRSNDPEARLFHCTEYDQDEYTTPYNDENVKIKPVMHPAGSSKGTLPSICYICEVADMRGSFCPEKAAALNIPNGPWRNELHCGKTVTLPDSRTIYPHQVVTPPVPGPLFAVIECTSKLTMYSLLNCDKFKQHFHSSNNKHFDVMLHITSQSIFESKRYQEWISEFGSQTNHVVLHEKTAACQRPSNIRTRLEETLCYIDPLLFPIALDKGNPSFKQELPTNCFEGQIGLVYNFFPLKKKGISEDSIYNPNFKRKAVRYFKERVNSYVGQLSDSYNTQVTFLGTASSRQSKLRGTSSILVELNSKCCFMLDCGDGTNYQMHCHYGDDTEKILSSLSFVFISHHHGDHHMGLVNLIVDHMKLREQGKVNKPIVIIGPDIVYLWLRWFSSLTMTDLEFRYYTFNGVKSGSLVTEMKELLCSTNLKRISLVPVYHCHESFGIVLTHNSGWKLVYSGDCIPSEELCKEGRDATLLIHEATFLPNYQKTADVKHSTIGEAIDVSKKMRAKYTILTHFSQRYTLADLLSTPLADRVCLAFDHMSVRLRDLPNLENQQAKIRRRFLKKKSF